MSKSEHTVVDLGCGGAPRLVSCDLLFDDVAVFDLLVSVPLWVALKGQGWRIRRDGGSNRVISVIHQLTSHPSNIGELRQVLARIRLESR